MAHLLVFGASGVSGWAVALQSLSYPSRDAFAHVTALTNRPLSKQDSMLPDDPRLQLASGIDLTGSVDSVVAGLQDKIKNIDSVTHVVFTAYIEKPDYSSLCEVNKSLVSTAVQAVEKVASGLQVFILQTGGKAYGLEFVGQIDFKPPFKESQPRVPSPLGDNIFYYDQYDELQRLSQGKPWGFFEVRPDVIVGFTPGTNFMNAAQGMGMYLSLCRELYGKGAKLAFPGTEKSWRNKHTDTCSDILAKQEIYLALNKDKTTSGSAFNAGDGEVTVWENKWPELCSYFDLVGGPPKDKSLDFEAFAKEHEGTWGEIARKHGLKKDIYGKYKWMFLWGILVPYDFDREYDLAAVRSLGFHETIKTADSWKLAFDRMRKGKIIP